MPQRATEVDEPAPPLRAPGAACRSTTSGLELDVRPPVPSGARAWGDRARCAPEGGIDSIASLRWRTVSMNTMASRRGVMSCSLARANETHPLTVATEQPQILSTTGGDLP